ncbi:hypothetical protein BRADI_2g37166v3 [Brachypodium distachyon]|uniref:Disease resistance protein RPM1 n=1 Tax=Brachypodium distachyon TaxID=15368 RepID=A0A0Q3IPD0_BRADI|nr:hypothetical protein BRADI_2g37166v3 [Brachypodium distachyon]
MEAAVSASLGAFGPLLGKLTNLLANECGRLKGVRREIRSLRSELTSMHGALKKYTKLEDPDDQVKEWMSLVRELAYDTEDCFDKFVQQLGDGGHDGGFKELFRKAARRLKTLGARRGIADQIDDLKARIKEVKDLKTSYKLDDIASSISSHAVVDPRLSALFAEEAHLVGIDGPRDDLAKWMVEDENKDHRKVLSIVGFGGLGKTTLANEVYRKIKGHFHCHAFVSVSQKPDTKKIVKDAIYQLISQVIPKGPCQDELKKDMQAWDEKKSFAMLRELLHDKRYIIIIDDVWSILAWNAIKCAFPENNCSSRIIATTRIFEVARFCCPDVDDKIYEMTPLSNLHSERLFFKRIFGSEDCCPDMLKEVSAEILKKCGGLPLAIISISCLLANKPHVKEEWEKVKRSIGSDLYKSKSLEGMKNILSLSYNDLPANLKTCLLYLSTFPEDYLIERERLVRRWIAEGFISEERGKSRQEVAEGYFYELINKSMVQPVGISFDGTVRACRVHDMLLELIISKSVEENFITVVNGRQTVCENSQCLIRRLSIQDIDQELASELAKKDLSHVRSLTVSPPGCIKHLPGLVKFQTLRVLDLEGDGELEEYDMSSMGNLFHLKYLRFDDPYLSELPLGVVMLHNLETLDLWGACINELPAGIVQLIKLQHLTGSYYGETKLPVGIGNMTNLREVSGFNITMSSVVAVEELGNLINLNVLDVQYISDDAETHNYKRHGEMLLSSLCKLGGYKLQSVFIRAHTGLTYLNINLSEVTEEDLRILGELPALLSLILCTNKVQKDRIPVRSRGFQCLKEFVFEPFSGGAATFLFEEGALPKLEKLELTFFVSMAKPFGFYFGIEHLLCLKDFEVDLYIEGATSAECMAAAAAIRKEVNLNPNHPRLTLTGEIKEDDTDNELNQEQSDADEES